MEVLSVTPPEFWRHNQQQRTVAFRLSDHTVAATRKYQRECAKVTAEAHFSTHALVMRISHLRDLRGDFCEPAHPDLGRTGLLEHHAKTQKVDLPDKNHTITPIRASTFTASYSATLPLPPSRSPSLPGLAESLAVQATANSSGYYATRVICMQCNACPGYSPCIALPL